MIASIGGSVVASRVMVKSRSVASPNASAIRKGDRRAIARAITLIESTRPDDRAAAEVLIETLLPHAGDAVRIGISGAPGVGKSTFIEAFGLGVIARGHRIAVLAVDPSSTTSGGAILGDKTRMEGLARSPKSFIRPSPTGGALGGVARRTRDAMIACEAAGFDVVVIETVGVGQSEVAVAELADLFILLVQPGSGDELQGIKRGIVERADLVVVTKADGALEAAARHTESDYLVALALARRGSGREPPRVMACSALEARGIDEIWQEIEARHAAEGASGAREARRARQATAWLWNEVEESVVAALKSDAAVQDLSQSLEAAVARGETSPAVAARRLVDTFLDNRASRAQTKPADLTAPQDGSKEAASR